MFIFCVIVLLLFYHNTGTNGLTCLSCSNIHHPRFCEYVSKCSVGQICGVERITHSMTKEVVYNTGCMSSKTCQIHPTEMNGTQPCFKCCSYDMCNKQGCGEQGVPDYAGRACFNCGGLLKPDNCKKISFCESTESCFIQEQSRFGERYYNSGCKKKQLCQSHIPSVAIGKRNIQRKRSTEQLICCSENLCNNDRHLLSPHSSNIAGTFGTDFDLFFQEPNFSLEKTRDTLLIVPSQFPIQIAMKIFSQNSDKFESTSRFITLTTSYFTYNLTNEAAIPSDGIGQFGVRLHSNISFAVFGIRRSDRSANSWDSEGYLALPSKYISTKYVVPTFNVSTTGLSKSIITVSPQTSDTVIHISVKTKTGKAMINSAGYGNGETAIAVLNEFDTLQMSHTSDLTGTLITASKPVFVASGNKCNSVTGRGECNPFIEMVLPTDQLDIKYIIPGIASRPESTVRILAVGTANVTIFVNNTAIVRNLKPREHIDFISKRVSFVQSSSDVLVTMYPHDISTDADAYMMTIHGINQYLPQYNFAVPSGFKSYISVTVLNDNIAHFVLDGRPMTTQNVSSIYTGRTDHYSTFTYPIGAGLHRIEHIHGGTFGLWVYGDASYESYGYQGGIAFKGKD